ncbi:MAG: DegT/DnrJ/EryC1/StrS family aminotransferase, partial [Propionibacteriaceae bacterium]|nr:DegT/DnrJ/EryC1/StrS family aminotransferase [Propionibacteriaceae bacterium]
KNLTAGEGGVVLTGDDGLAERLYGYVNVGRVRGGGWYDHRGFGLNLRLTEFQGAILDAQMADLADLQRRRAANAQRLRDRLAGLAGLDLPPAAADGTVHGQHLFTMRFPDLGPPGRDRLLALLQAGGLRHASSGYVALHRSQPLLDKAMRNAHLAGRDCPVPHCPRTDERVGETIWLPQPVLLAEPAVVDQVADLIRASLSAVRGRP